jgi:hypothetical protein
MIIIIIYVHFYICTVYWILGQQHLTTKGERFIC